MPIGTGIVYNVGDLILSQVSSSGTAFLETKIAAATSSLIYFDSTARINSASLNSITVGTASYVSGSRSIITNLTASNISASGTSSFGYVGIGTVNPAYKLDVNGNANFTNGFYTNTDASSTSYFVGANGTRPIIFQNNTATSYDFGFKFTDSNTFTIVGGNTLANPTTDLVSFKYDGKVGIGTTNPSALLHIYTGSLGSTAYPLLIDNSSGGAGVNIVGIGFANGGIMKHSITTAIYGNDYMAFNVGQGASYNQERMRIDSNGNVGIGTTIPNNKLDIWGGTGTTLNMANVDDSGRGGKLTFISSSVTGRQFYVGTNSSIYNLVFGIDSIEKMRLDTSGNLGIGTSSPTVRLHVSGSSIITNPNPGANSAVLLVQDDGTATTVKDGTTLRVVNNGSAANFSVFEASSGVSDFVILNNGNVGIGTTSPNSKLEVAGTAGTAVVSVTNSGTGRSGSFGIDNNGVFIRNSSNGDYFDLQNATGTSRFRVLYDTNTYLNTTFTSVGSLTASGSKLSVFGNLSVGSTYGAITASSNGAIFEGDVGIGTTTPTAQSNYRFLQVNGTNSAVIETMVGGTRIGGFDSTSNTLYVGSIGSFPVVFRTAVDEKMRITAAGLVGIGTSVPATKLDVKGNVFVANAADGNNTIAFGNIGGLGPLNGAPDNLTGSAFLVVSSSTASGAPSHMKFYTTTGGTCGERMRIDESGNIGMGTISPNAKLQVVGNISGTSFTSSISNAVGFLGTSSWAQNVVSASYATTAQTANALNTGNSYTITNLTASNISASLTGSFGIVGIGTNSPTQKLHVVGTVFGTTNGQFGNAVITGTGAGFAVFGSNAGATGVKINLDSDITRNDLVISASTGYVGIGSSSPGAKLDVVGDLRIKSAGAAIILDTTTTSDGRMEYKYNGTRKALIGVDSDNLQISADSGNYLQFRTNGSQRMIINNAGGVGIGTSNPNYAFDVYTNGSADALMSIRASGSANARIYFDAANGDLTGGDYCHLGQDKSTLNFVINTGGSAGNIHLQPKEGTNNGILFVSGSTRFGLVSTQNHQFTGSVNISGSLNATASWANNAVSASYALSSSFATTAQTANALNASNTYTIAGLTSAYVDVNGSATIPSTGIYRPSSKTLGLSADATLILKINGSVSPYVTSIETGNFLVQSGNVGIGTTNATDKLTLYGELASYKTGADTIQTQVYLANAGNTRAFNLQLNSGGTGLDLWSYNSSNAWLRHTTFNYDGNVGIGTAVPAAKLEITGSSNSALLNIKSPISGAILYVSGSGAVGIGTSNVGAFTLQVSGSFGATTKSFIIDHPTKEGKKLMYGSLESPYHGIRLTGRDTIKDGKCKVELPDYMYKLILHDSINIQLTGIKCNKTLYVDEINIPENYFTIAYDKGVFESYKDYDFFWDFTAIRADVPELNTEL